MIRQTPRSHTAQTGLAGHTGGNALQLYRGIIHNSLKLPPAAVPNINLRQQLSIQQAPEFPHSSFIFITFCLLNPQISPLHWLCSHQPKSTHAVCPLQSGSADQTTYNQRHFIYTLKYLDRKILTREGRMCRVLEGYNAPQSWAVEFAGANLTSLMIYS